MLRSRFESVPSAFSGCFLPGRSRKSKQEDSVLHFYFKIQYMLMMQLYNYIDARYLLGVLNAWLKQTISVAGWVI